MVRFAIVGTIAALTTGTFAFPTTCTPSQFYCGFNLLNGDNYDLWKGRIDEALKERNVTADQIHEYNSLFFCSTSTTLALDEYCFDTPGYACQNANSNTCSGSNPLNKNDCCGPSN